MKIIDFSSLLVLTAHYCSFSGIFLAFSAAPERPKIEKNAKIYGKKIRLSDFSEKVAVKKTKFLKGIFLINHAHPGTCLQGLFH